MARLDGFRCVLLDRPGCGLSVPVGSRFDGLERLAAFADALVVDLLDAMGLDRAHLVATSFGGYIALRTAAAHPDRVGRLVELGWTFGAPVAGLPLLMRLATVPPVGRLLTAVPPSSPTPSSSWWPALATPCGWTTPTRPPRPSGAS